MQDLIIEIEFVKLTCSQIQFEYCSWELNLLQNSGFVEVHLFCLFGLFECVLLWTWRVTFFVNTVNISVNFFPWFLQCIVVASENLVSILLRHFSPLNNRFSKLSVTGSGEIFAFNQLLPLAIKKPKYTLQNSQLCLLLKGKTECDLIVFYIPPKISHLSRCSTIK